MKIPPTLEPLVRQVLHALPADERISTAELAGRIAGFGHGERAERNAVMGHLLKLAENTVGLCIRAEPIERYGRLIYPRLWHHIDSPAMPERPHKQSMGAASQGTSLQQQINELRTDLASLRAYVETLRSPGVSPQ